MHGLVNRWVRLPRGVRVAATTLAVLLAVFWLLARFWLPGFVRTQAEAALTAALHRPVTIAAVEIRPFALSLTVRDLAVGGGAGGPRTAGEAPPKLLSFAEFHVDLSLASLWHRAPVLSALRLVDPEIHLIREADGRLSIADLAGRPGAATDGNPAGPLPGFSLANVEIKGGRFVFEDRQKGSRQEVSELALGIPFAGTIAQQREDWVEPYFKAKLNGAPFEATGRVKPFADRREATLEVRLKDLDLTGFDEYAPLPAGLRVLSAKLDVDLDLVFVQAPGRPMQLQLKGGAALRQVGVENLGGAPYLVGAERVALQVEDLDAGLQRPIRAGLAVDALVLREKAGRAGGPPLLALPKLEAKGLAVDLAKRSIDLASLDVHGLQVALQREADGRLDAVRVLAPANPGPPKGVPSSDPAGIPSGHPEKGVPSGHPEKGVPSGHNLRKNGPAAAPAAPDVEAAGAPNGLAAAPPWSGSLGRFALTGGGLSFTDRTLARAVPLVVDGLSSKYFAVFLALAYAAHIVAVRRDGRRGFDLALLVVCALPGPLLNLWWNSTHCWNNVMFNVFNRHEKSVPVWKTLPYYAATVVYLAGPYAAWVAWKARADWRRAPPPAAVAGLLALLPLALFGLLALGRTVGLHWPLAYVPLLLAWLAAIAPVALLPRWVLWSAAIAALHALVIAGVLLAPASAWKNTKYFESLVLAVHPDRVLAPLRDLGPDWVLANDGYSNAATLAYHAGRPFVVFGPGASHARQDDAETDWRALDGRNIAIYRKTDWTREEFDPYFERVDYQEFDVEGVRFTLIRGHGFRYAAYRDGVLAGVRERWYRLPAWLPDRGCYIRERHFPDRPMPVR